ncbi:SAV_915 family protein [Streptomyces sp. NPDC048332]|uniref:SAV_915 family protein n=1 Tax=Streptomyces sp. NPDC048332 TaxID=3154619 RepID=UPI003445BD5C
MNDSQRAEDPDPLHPHRAGALLVPVRPGPVGHCARLFRTPLGVRTAVAFTDESRLTRTLGRQQAWIRLSEPAVRALVAPLGVVHLTVDPLMTAPGPGDRPADRPRRSRRPARDPRPVDVPRVSGAPSLSASTS